MVEDQSFLVLCLKSAVVKKKKEKCCCWIPMSDWGKVKPASSVPRSFTYVKGCPKHLWSPRHLEEFDGKSNWWYKLPGGAYLFRWHNYIWQSSGGKEQWHLILLLLDHLGDSLKLSLDKCQSCQTSIKCFGDVKSHQRLDTDCGKMTGMARAQHF